MRFVRRHPFLLLGLATVSLLFAVMLLERSGNEAGVRLLGPTLRILIVPMYIVWLPFTMLMVALIGSGPPTGAMFWIALMLRAVSLVAGLGPYSLADHLIQRWVRRGVSGGSRGGVAPPPEDVGART